MNDDLQHENLKGDTYNEVKKNDIPMDVNIGMKPFTDFQLQHKHISIDGKDNDDPVIPSYMVPQVHFQFMSYHTTFLL